MIQPGQHSYKVERVSDVKRLRFSEATTLSGLSESYEFVSHGALLTFGGLPTDPIQSWYEHNPSGERPGMLMAERPVFDGLCPARQSDSIWNYGIVLVPKDQWPSLRLYLDSISAADFRSGVFWRVLRQSIPVIDFRAIERNQLSNPTFVNVNVYGIDGNTQLIHFRPPFDGVGLVRVVHDKPEQATKLLAMHVLKKGHVVVKETPSEV